MKTLFTSLITLILIMVSSASTVPVLENGEFVFPEPSGYVTGDQIAEILERNTPASLNIVSHPQSLCLEANVREGAAFEIQYSCDMENWEVIVNSTGQGQDITFVVDYADFDSSCAFFRLVEVQ